MIVDVSKENCIRAASDGDSDTVRRYFAQLETRGSRIKAKTAKGAAAGAYVNSESSSTSRAQHQDKCDDGESDHDDSDTNEPATLTAAAPPVAAMHAKTASSFFFFRNQADMTRTLFAEAIENGHVAVVQTLLTPPVRACIQQSLSALLPELLVAAIEEDYPEIVECLLTLGGANANASATSESSSSSGDAEQDAVSPLCKAAELGSLEAAQLLVGHGADVRARHDRTGRTALHAAAKQGDADLVAFLLASGADVDAQDYARRETALVSAVKKGNCAVVALLIAANARLDVPNMFGSTALHVARVEGQREICALLEAAGAQVLEVPRTPRRV